MKGASEILTQNYVTPRGRGFEKVNENGDREASKGWTYFVYGPLAHLGDKSSKYGRTSLGTRQLQEVNFRNALLLRFASFLHEVMTLKEPSPQLVTKLLGTEEYEKENSLSERD